MSAPGQIHHPHPVPYYDDSPAHPAPACRVLFAAGAWVVPESERPADWQDRMEQRVDAVPELPEFLRGLQPKRPLPAKAAKAKPQPRVKVAKVKAAKVAKPKGKTGGGKKVNPVEGDVNATGTITFIREIEQSGKRRRALLRCECGREWVAGLIAWAGNHMASCGCSARSAFRSSDGPELVRRREAGEGFQDIGRVLGVSEHTARRAYVAIKAAEAKA